MKSRKNLALLWIFSALPAVALLFLYGRLPEQVPTNFGFDGTVNAYSPRSTMWLLALLGPFMALMFQILPQIDPKRRNYAKFQKYYDQFAIFLELFLLVVFSLTLTEQPRPGTVSIGRAVTALVSVLLILIDCNNNVFCAVFILFFKPSPLLKNSLIRIISLIAGFVTIFKIKRGCRIQMQKALFLTRSCISILRVGKKGA